MTLRHKTEIAQALVDWFSAQGRDYPWRRTTDAWAILVSEIMLQQTTIPTVLGRYESWMQQFPTPAHLAQASEEEALRSWEGLGYYRRVRSLQAAARAIVQEHGGIFPTSEADIRKLPGIGDYTVGAVLSFAFNQPAPLVDANVSRVFARLFNDHTPIDSPTGRKQQWKTAAELVHRTNPRAYNSALMELGQQICTTGVPSCILCPLKNWCQASNPESLPVKLPRKEITALEHHDILQLSAQGLLMEKQSSGKRHEGMYRLPQRSREACANLPLLCTQKYSITRYKVTRHLYQAAPESPLQPGEEWVPLERLNNTPMASPDRKIISRYLSESR